MTRLEVEGATLEKEYAGHAYRIYRFEQPLAPQRKAPHHLRDAARAARLPQHRQRASHRRQRHLPRQPGDRAVAGHGPQRRAAGPRQAPQVRPAARTAAGEARGRGRARLQHACGSDSDWVTADITVSTSADQVAIAPGYLVSDTIDGRPPHVPLPQRRADPATSSRCSRRATRWRRIAGTTSSWRSTTTRRTPTTCERMHAAMKASLDYFTQNFSPFQFRQVRILEFPAYAELRAVVRQHDSVLGGHRLHRRLPRPGEDRHGHLRHGARGRAPVVGPPGHQRATSRARPCWSSRWRSTPR